MTQTADLQRIRARVEIGAPPERVHRALTDELERWLADAAAVDLSAGRYDFWGPHVFEAPDRDAGRHPLLGHDPGRLLRFGWRVRGADTEVAIALEPAGAGTRVEVTQAGVPQRAEGAASIDDLWKVTLENLRRWCERGEAPVRVDFSRLPVGEARSGITIEAPPEAVFENLVDPARVSEWCGAQAEVEPAVGGRYSFGWERGGPVEILDLDAPHRLAYTWAYPPEPETVVTWELEGSGGRTRLTIMHTGFGDRNVADYECGWTGFLVTIRNQVEGRA